MVACQVSHVCICAVMCTPCFHTGRGEHNGWVSSIVCVCDLQAHLSPHALWGPYGVCVCGWRVTGFTVPRYGAPWQSLRDEQVPLCDVLPRWPMGERLAEQGTVNLADSCQLSNWEKPGGSPNPPPPSHLSLLLPVPPASLHTAKHLLWGACKKQ